MTKRVHSKVKALGKARKVTVRLNASRGKGSRQTLYYGSSFTIVRNPKVEMKTGTYHAMCGQLGVKPNDWWIHIPSAQI